MDEQHRLVGVLSRSVLQRRLAEDEPLPPARATGRRREAAELPRLRSGRFLCGYALVGSAVLR